MSLFNFAKCVYLLKNEDNQFSGFTVGYNKKRYLVTVRHTFNKYAHKDCVKFTVDKSKQYDTLTGVIYFHESSDIDIAVIELDDEIPTLNLSLDNYNPAYGQDFFFMGFPFGYKSETEINKGYPIPFIKKGIFSNAINSEKSSLYFIDAHNNKGFSGGPVFCQSIDNYKYHIIGVIRGYIKSDYPIAVNGLNILIPENSGLTICTPFTHFKEIISKIDFDNSDDNAN